MTDTPLPPTPPATIYADRLAARRAAAAALVGRLDTLSWARLAAFLLTLLLAGLGFGTDWLSPWFALLPAAGFLYLVAKFEMTRGRLAWANRAGAFYSGGLARLAGKPGGFGDGARFADDAHPSAADLDLFGPGSVFERITACRTRVGEDTLAAWLKAPADPPEVKARQEAVADLTPRLDLREGVAVAGAVVPAADYGWLAAWGATGWVHETGAMGSGLPPHPPHSKSAATSPSGGEVRILTSPPEGEVAAEQRDAAGGGDSPSPPRSRSGFAGAPAPWKRWAVELLGWGNVLAWLGWLFVGTTSLPVIGFGLLSLALAIPLLPWARRVLAPLEKAERDLSLLQTLLARLEREPFASARLKELQAAMTAGGLPASAQIHELRTLLTWYDSRRNPLFLPVAILRMWDVRFAFKLEAWRTRSGAAVGSWLRAVGEAETLSSLAGYAFENPADVFPTVLPSPPGGDSSVAGVCDPGLGSSIPADGTGLCEAGPGSQTPATENTFAQTGACRVSFSAVALGHPLIPTDRCVANDVTIGGAGPRVLLVSGSNMSGKSTLLRAVGVNCVLALAGGVVRAKALTLTPLIIGATMRVQDSLQAGRSRFFAEVTKVRQLLDLAKAAHPPLLFLLDELFSGTNSADRVAGAEGVVRALVAAGAVGFVTTHDLVLTGVADRLPGAVNVHFCDGFAGGELKFDYTMRPGVVAHGNGLALMRAVGLEV